MANKIQEIGGALYYLAMSAVADKDIVTELTKMVELLTQKNSSLTVQLSNTIKLNLNMAKKLNLKPTQ